MGRGAAAAVGGSQPGAWLHGDQPTLFAWDCLVLVLKGHVTGIMAPMLQT